MVLAKVCLLFGELEIKPKASYKLGQFSTAEPHPGNYSDSSVLIRQATEE